jgi:hypothetical protein
MTKIAYRSLLPLLLALLLVPATATLADGMKSHKVVLQINDNDPARMNLLLNNASNLIAHYQQKNEPIEIEIVAYGPGLHMLRADTSPVQARIKSFAQSYDNVSFAACGNTKENMSKQAGKEIPLMHEAKLVQAGVVHIIERQEQGWSYVRP